jgi:hypothetical protein
MAIYHALAKKKTQGSVVGTSVTPSSRGAARGAASSPVYGQAVPPVANSANAASGVQETTYINPRATTPVPPTFGQVGSAAMGTFYSSITLGTSTTPGQPAFLKNQSDIVGLSLDVSETITTTSSGTSSGLFSSVFDHFVIQSPDGLTIMNVPGGQMVSLLGIWGTYPPGNSPSAALLGAVATLQTAQLFIPTSLPQQQNSYVFIPTFNTITGAGTATATVDVASVNLNIEYGDAQKGTLNALAQQYTIAAATYTDLAPTSIAKNKSIAGMLVTGTTLSAIDEFYLESNGAPVEAFSAGSAGDMLTNRMTRQFTATIPSGGFIYIPKSQFVANDSSFIRIHNTTTAQTWTVEWLWYT